MIEGVLTFIIGLILGFFTGVGCKPHIDEFNYKCELQKKINEDYDNRKKL